MKKENFFTWQDETKINNILNIAKNNNFDYEINGNNVVIFVYHKVKGNILFAIGKIGKYEVSPNNNNLRIKVFI